MTAQLGRIGSSTGHGASIASGVRGSDSDELLPVELCLRSEESKEAPRPIGDAKFVSSRSERLGSISRSGCGPLQESTEAVASLSCGWAEESRASKQSLGETAGSVVSELDIATASSTK